jgi:hypothetical protein
MKKHNEIFSISATLAFFVIMGRTLYTTLAHEHADLADVPASGIADEAPVVGSSLLQTWKSRSHPKQAVAHKPPKRPSQPQQPDGKTASLFATRSQLLFAVPAGFSLVASCALVALISCIVSGGFGGDEKLGAGEKMLPPSLGEGAKTGTKQKETEAGAEAPQTQNAKDDLGAETKAPAETLEPKSAGPPGPGPESEASEAMKLAKAMIASKADVGADVADTSKEVMSAANSEAIEAMKLAKAMIASKADVAGAGIEAKTKQDLRKPPTPKATKKRSDLARTMAAKAAAP